jgi:hypothetical protein
MKCLNYSLDANIMYDIKKNTHDGVILKRVMPLR